MAIIQLNSADPHFSYIIKKNPQSGMQLKNIRQGIAFAWYSNNNESYNIYFKDADNKVSFGDQEFEFLNTNKYNSPAFVLSAISNFLNSTSKEEIEIDKQGIKKTCIVNMIHIENINYIKHFKKYFIKFDIDISHYISKSYKLTITTNESFYKLLNFINLMMLFVILTTKDEYIHLDKSGLEKYISCIEKLNAPFFIKYLFSRNVLRTKVKFNKYKSRLESSEDDNIMMCYGSTATQRKNAIQEIISFDKSIIDIGCGEGFYALPFSIKIKNYDYIAIDTSEEIINGLKKKIIKENITNIKLFNSTNDFIEINGADKKDIILTEVIEHMEKDDAVSFIVNILNNINFDKFIITVPNKDFNKFYMINDDEFRHEDHKWEPTEQEFQKFIIDNIAEIRQDIYIEFINIGDKVNGISTTIGVVITNTNKGI